MNQPVSTKFAPDLLLTAIAAVAMLAWGVSKISQPTLGNVVGGVGWVAFSCCAVAWVVMSVRKVTHELAWRIQKIANYLAFATVLIALFLPRS